MLSSSAGSSQGNESQPTPSNQKANILLARLKKALQSNETTETARFQESKNNLSKTDYEELNHNIEAGENLIKALPGVWHLSISQKLKNYLQQLANGSVQQGRMKGSIVRFQFYLKAINKINDHTWWQQVRFYIGDQISRFAYLNPANSVSTQLSLSSNTAAKPGATDKNKVATILSFILEEFKNSYEASDAKYFHDSQKISNQLATLRKQIADLKGLKISLDIIPKQELLPYKTRMNTAEKLKKLATSTLDSTEAKWKDYGNLPTLRPILLIIIANIYTQMLEWTKEESGPLEHLRGLLNHSKTRQLEIELQKHLEKIAEVMFWQEQSYQQTKNADLVLHLSNELLNILSNDLNKPEYNVHELEFGPNGWAPLDFDLKKILMEYAEANDKEWISEYLDFIPKENTALGHSKFRCHFILQYGSAAAKQIVQQLVYEKSSQHIANKIAHFSQSSLRYQEIFKFLIKNYIIVTCEAPKRIWNALLEKPADFTHTDLLTDYPVLIKLFDEKVMFEAAEQICALITLHNNITDQTAWEYTLTLSETTEFEKYKTFILKLIAYTEKETKEQTQAMNAKFTLEESKALIKEYLLRSHKFNIAHHPKPDELKNGMRVPALEIALLYPLYWNLNSKANWTRAMDEDKYAHGLLKHPYHDLLKTLILHGVNYELSDELWSQWRVCQHRIYQCSLRKEYSMTFALKNSTKEASHVFNLFKKRCENMHRKHHIFKELADNTRTKFIKEALPTFTNQSIEIIAEYATTDRSMVA